MSGLPRILPLLVRLLVVPVDFPLRLLVYPSVVPVGFFLRPLFLYLCLGLPLRPLRLLRLRLLYLCLGLLFLRSVCACCACVWVFRFIHAIRFVCFVPAYTNSEKTKVNRVEQKKDESKFRRVGFCLYVSAL